MGKKKRSSIIISTVLAFLIVVCGGGQNLSKANAATLKSAPQQVINVSLPQDPASFDSSKIADSASNTIVQETQEGLVRLNNNKIVAAGAKSWKVSPNGLVWTFNLRDYTYSDGKKVTAQDYVYAVKRAFDPAIACPNAAIFYCIKGSEAYNTNKGKAEDVGVKAVDDKTLQFTLVASTPYFIQLMNFVSLLPLRQDVVEKAGDTYGTDPKAMVFTGPFVVDQWIKGSKVILKKNTKYWDEKNVKIDTANVLIVPEEATRQQLFDTQGLDLISDVKAEYAQKLAGKIKNGDVSYIIGYYPSTGYIAFNNKDKNGIFTNAKVRLAFSIAIDRQGYVKNVLKKDQAAYGFVPYGMNIGDKVYRDVVAQPLKSALGKDPKALLKEGLKELGLDPNKKLEITFLQRNANSDQKVVGEFYQDQWQKKLGVTVKIDVASDGATFNSMIMKGLYQVCQTGWGADYNDPMTFMGMFLTGDGNNSTFFSDKEYDSLVKGASTINDMNKRQISFMKAEKILVLDKASIAPISFKLMTNYLQGYVKGLQVQAGGPAFELKSVYIDKK
jgi:oligopeptide transport system substrate-binding protein